MLFTMENAKLVLAGNKTQTRRIVQPGDTFSEPVLKDFVIVAERKYSLEQAEERVNATGGLKFRCWRRNGRLKAYVVQRSAVVPGRGKSGFWRYFSVSQEVPLEDARWESAHEAEHYEQAKAAVGDGNNGRDLRGWLALRGYSRQFIFITAMQVERLQSITEADARAEGVVDVAAYRTLWDSINKAKDMKWQANPLVAVLTFERVQEWQS